MMRFVAVMALLALAVVPAGAQERVRTIAQIRTSPGVIEVLARSSDGVHIGLGNGVFTYNGSAFGGAGALRDWIGGARAIADTNVVVAKNEVVMLKVEHFPGCSFDLTREAAGRGGLFHFNSSTDYGAGSINLWTDRKGFLRFLAALDTASVAALQMGVAGKSREVDDTDFSGKGIGGGTAPINTGQPYFEFQVEKQVQQIPGTGALRYPETLRSTSVEGEVLAQFVVDANGRYVSGTFKVLKSSHELFTQAVKDALPNMRFYPAMIGGQSVPQLVQQPFAFSLSKGQ
jgi:TonB family protein